MCVLCVQAAVRGLMSREHQMLTWHTIAGDLEAKQVALAAMDKSKVRLLGDWVGRQMGWLRLLAAWLGSDEGHGWGSCWTPS